jgi:hypothetical protein
MSPTTSTDAQLAWEARWARPVGVTAAAGAVALILDFPLRSAALGSGDGADAQLIHVHDHPGVQYASGAVGLVAGLALAVTLFYLYGATRARRPQLLTAALYLGLGGGLVLGFTRVAQSIGLLHVAADFAKSRVPADLGKITNPHDYLKAVSPEERAKDAGSSSILPTLSALAFASLLATAFSLVLINLNAMRAGLLTQFMGVIGIIVGVLFALFGGPPPVVAGFWMGAIAVLLLDRWPGGRGEAWATGEEGVWLSKGQRMRAEQLQRRAAEEAEAGDAPPAEDTERTAARRSKKRKKRR